MIIPKSAAERQEWLNSLQVGDEVAVEYGSYRLQYAIRKIDKITPSRMMDAGNLRFGSDGRQRGEGRAQLEPLTDQIREHVARSNALYHLRTLHFDSLSTQQLLDILKIIQGGEK